MSSFLQEYRSITKRKLARLDPNTQRAYTDQLENFFAWCEDRSITTLPVLPQTVTAYAEYMLTNGASLNTIKVAVGAISWLHRELGHESPCQDESVKRQLESIKRVVGDEQVEKLPFLPGHIRKMAFESNMGGLRDRSLVTLAWYVGLRPHEVLSLTLRDIQLHTGHALVWVDEHLRLAINVPEYDLFPLDNLRGWLSKAEIGDDEVVYPSITQWGEMKGKMTRRGLYGRVRDKVEEIGLNPRHYSADSLRHGYTKIAAVMS